MSVMLVDETKAGSLIEGICNISGMWRACRIMEHTDTGKLYNKPVKKFVRDLYHANLATYNHKYNECESILDIFPATGFPMNRHQTLKTLQCLHYNIELEYFPTGKKLLETVESMINDIKDSIIESSKEYQKAIWG